MSLKNIFLKKLHFNTQAGFQGQCGPLQALSFCHIFDPPKFYHVPKNLHDKFESDFCPSSTKTASIYLFIFYNLEMSKMAI